MFTLNIRIGGNVITVASECIVLTKNRMLFCVAANCRYFANACGFVAVVCVEENTTSAQTNIKEQ